MRYELLLHCSRSPADLSSHLHQVQQFLTLVILRIELHYKHVMQRPDKLDYDLQFPPTHADVFDFREERTLVRDIHNRSASRRGLAVSAVDTDKSKEFENPDAHFLRRLKLKYRCCQKCDFLTLAFRRKRQVSDSDLRHKKSRIETSEGTDDKPQTVSGHPKSATKVFAALGCDC